METVFGNVSFGTGLAVLICVRAAAAYISHITDCDEVFNYWEPLHYLLHGNGLQTWEYSPEYGLRSYFYLLLHSWPAYLLDLAGISKATAFFATRALLGFACALCEIKFCAAIAKSCAFGKQVAGGTFLFLALSSGMFHASVAFLPSTTAMYMCMVAITAWMNGSALTAVLAVAFTTILVWPFSGAIGLPIAIDIVLRQQRLVFFIKTCVLALVVFLPLTVVVDSFFYQKTVFPALNIVMYNVLSGSTSSELYGTEPWTFYFVNGFLNLNVAFPMGLLGLLFAVVCGSVGLPKKKATFELTPIWYLSPLVVWIAIFFPQAHKEERFIFPVYPLICLSASYALLVSTRLISKLASKIVSFSIRTPLKLLSQLVYVVFLLVSMSRTAALYKGYHAPMKIYQHVAELEATTPSRLCVGKEWYRFSSSFFLPKNNALSIEFIKSGYDGLLPKPFSAVNGTSIIPTHMNNMNAEEPTRYVDLDTCDYIVDQETGSPNYRSQAEWAEQVCYPFLDPARSNGLFRAFYIPFLSEKKTEHNAYCLLKRAQ